MTTTTDDDRVNIEQSASGRLEGRVLQYSCKRMLTIQKLQMYPRCILEISDNYKIKFCHEGLTNNLGCLVCPCWCTASSSASPDRCWSFPCLTVMVITPTFNRQPVSSFWTIPVPRGEEMHFNSGGNQFQMRKISISITSEINFNYKRNQFQLKEKSISITKEINFKWKVLNISI